MLQRIDKLGVVLVALLAGLGLAGTYAALHFGWFNSPWEMAGWFVVGLAFLAAGVGVQGKLTPRNTNVHGAARPASESEAQASARGDTTSASLHDQTFPE